MESNMDRKSEYRKLVHELNVRDILNSPVWRYCEDESGELAVEPIDKYPVQSLENCVAGIKVKFANGYQSWALVANFDLNSSKKNKHFLSFTFLDEEEQIYTLPRYFDAGYDKATQEELPAILRMAIEDIFPVSYDLTLIADGDQSILSSSFDLMSAPERLTDNELIALAVVS